MADIDVALVAVAKRTREDEEQQESSSNKRICNVETRRAIAALTPNNSILPQRQHGKSMYEELVRSVDTTIAFERLANEQRESNSRRPPPLEPQTMANQELVAAAMEGVRNNNPTVLIELTRQLNAEQARILESNKLLHETLKANQSRGLVANFDAVYKKAETSSSIRSFVDQYFGRLVDLKDEDQGELVRKQFDALLCMQERNRALQLDMTKVDPYAICDKLLSQQRTGRTTDILFATDAFVSGTGVEGTASEMLERMREASQSIDPSMSKWYENNAEWYLEARFVGTRDCGISEEVRASMQSIDCLQYRTAQLMLAYTLATIDPSLFESGLDYNDEYTRMFSSIIFVLMCYLLRDLPGAVNSLVWISEDEYIKRIISMTQAVLYANLAAQVNHFFLERLVVNMCVHEYQAKSRMMQSLIGCTSSHGGSSWFLSQLAAAIEVDVALVPIARRVSKYGLYMETEIVPETVPDEDAPIRIEQSRIDKLTTVSYCQCAFSMRAIPSSKAVSITLKMEGGATAQLNVHQSFARPIVDYHLSINLGRILARRYGHMTMDISEWLTGVVVAHQMCSRLGIYPFVEALGRIQTEYTQHLTSSDVLNIVAYQRLIDVVKLNMPETNEERAKLLKAIQAGRTNPAGADLLRQSIVLDGYISRPLDIERR